MEVFGFNLSQGNLWLLGIAGTLVTTFVGYRLGLFQASIARKAAAAATFRNAVHTAMANVPPVDAHWGSEIDPTLRELRRAVAVAVADYKPYLSIKGQVHFETVHQKFIVQIEKGIPHAFNTGVILYGEPGGARKAKEAVFDYVRQLLAYAQHR